MSEELKLLERWIHSGIFSDTTELVEELTIAQIAELIYNLQLPPVEILDTRMLLLVSAVKYFKLTKNQINPQSLYDALINYHVLTPYDETFKQEWLSNFLNPIYSSK